MVQPVCYQNGMGGGGESHDQDSFSAKADLIVCICVFLCICVREIRLKAPVVWAHSTVHHPDILGDSLNFVDTVFIIQY